MNGEDRSENTPLVEGRDFYWESGLMVMTGAFLRRRGYCCDSGCRHCPYGDRPDDGEASKAPSRE
jgi:hypothetical protein